MTIRPADPREPGARALLAQSHALMEALFPPEDNHYLSLEELRAAHIRFFVAEAGGQIVATGAVALQDGWAEVKSMFTDPAARGRGVARALLARLEAEARAHGAQWLRLETGNRLHTALALYRACGFKERGPFGDYAANATSVFMEKRL